jgi:hypothetical protein
MACKLWESGVFKKTIAERGWNPLNYNLLNHPDLTATKSTYISDEDAEIEKNRISKLTPLAAINTTIGVAGDAVNSFLFEEMKNKGRLEI